MENAKNINIHIERAITYIQETVRNEKAPTLDQIAKAAHLSKFHFHRIYKLVTGETCIQTITRIRLAKGIDTLNSPEHSITSAAMTAGYSSSQAFAKAINRELGQTASDLRADSERIAVAIRTLSIPSEVVDDNGVPNLKIELASLEPFEIVAKHTEGQYPELHSTYDNLFEFAEDPQLVKAILGRPLGDIEESDSSDFEFTCALLLNKNLIDLPDTFTKESVESGTYLLARNLGSYDNLSATLDQLYSYILLNQNIELADAPCLFHYLDSPDEVNEIDLRTDVYIQVNLS